MKGGCYLVDFKKALESWKQRGKPKLTEKQIEGIFNMAVMNKLSTLSASWKKVQPIQPSFSNVPDGDYVGDLKEMKLAQSKKGRWQVEWSFEIADGDNEGKTCKRFDGITEDNGAVNETGMGYLKNVFEIIGFDAPEVVESWQVAFDAFVAGNVTDLYDITIKINNNYANVYINGISDFVKGEAPAEEVVGEEVVEEIVEEEVVEEQQVVAPTRRVQTIQQVAKPKVNAQPVRAAQPVRRTVVAQPQPQRRIISTRK